MCKIVDEMLKVGRFRAEIIVSNGSAYRIVAEKYVNDWIKYWSTNFFNLNEKFVEKNLRGLFVVRKNNILQYLHNTKEKFMHLM